MAKMVCKRIAGGDIELKVTLNLGIQEVRTIQHIKDSLSAAVRPRPINVGCEYDGNIRRTHCTVVMNSYTSDPGIFEAISSLSRVVSAFEAVDAIDVCGLARN